MYAYVCLTGNIHTCTYNTLQVRIYAQYAGLYAFGCVSLCKTGCLGSYCLKIMSVIYYYLIKFDHQKRSLLWQAICSGKEIQLHSLNGTGDGLQNYGFIAHVHVVYQITVRYTQSIQHLVYCSSMCAQGIVFCGTLASSKQEMIQLTNAWQVSCM